MRPTNLNGITLGSLVKLDYLRLCGRELGFEELLGALAEWAVRFAEDSDLVVGNGSLETVRSTRRV